MQSGRAVVSRAAVLRGTISFSRSGRFLFLKTPTAPERPLLACASSMETAGELWGEVQEKQGAIKSWVTWLKALPWDAIMAVAFLMLSVEVPTLCAIFVGNGGGGCSDDGSEP